MRATTSKPTGADTALLLGLAAVLVAFLLWPFVQHAFRVPLGPDAPVYLWWARLAGVDGLSAVGSRPGVPALLLSLTGALHLPLAGVTAGLEVAAGAAVGLAAAAFARIARPARGESDVGGADSPGNDRDRPGWFLAGLLCGVFAVHLAAGYLANLVFAVAFLAALAVLATRTRRAAIAAAGLLGGGSLSHPEFFVLGVAILAIAAVPSVAADHGRVPWRDAEFGRIGMAVVGGAAVVGVGLAAMLVGAPTTGFETSKDGYLRSLGLSSELRAAYWSRFLDRSARYVEWASIPLAVAGVGRTHGFPRRALLAWCTASVAGIIVALATGWFPADRFVTFCYAVPILAAFGLVRVARASARRRWIGVAAAACLGAVMIIGAALAWRRQEPFIALDEIRSATAAGRVAESAPNGTTFAFIVLANGASGAFELARAGNVIRASLPPSLIRSTVVVAPCPGDSPSGAPTPSGELARALATSACRELSGARAGGLESFLLQPFSGPEATAFASSGTLVAPGVRALPASTARPGAPAPEPAAAGAALDDPLTVPTTMGIVVASLAVLAASWLVGYGWARAAVDSVVAARALAPAFGLAALTLAAVVVDRLGLRLSGSLAATAAASLAAVTGYVARFVGERRARPEPPSEIHKQP